MDRIRGPALAAAAWILSVALAAGFQSPGTPSPARPQASLVPSPASASPTPAMVPPAPFPAAKAGVKPAPTKPGPAQPAVLVGTVKGPDGKPIEGAWISALRAAPSLLEQPARTATDTAGAFRLTLVRSGAPVPFGARSPFYRVRIQAPGLAAVFLEKIDPTAPLVVQLRRGLTLEGVVRDGGTRQPVAGARVRMREDGADRGSLQDDPHLATTDAAGRFTVSGLASTPHLLWTSAPGFGLAERRNVMPQSGKPVEMFLFPGSSVAGRVTGFNGQPLAGARIRLEVATPSRRGPLPEEKSDTQGRYAAWGVPPALYRLIATLEGHAPAWSSVEVPADREVTADVRLERGRAVTGRVVTTAGLPIAASATVQESEGQSLPAPVMTALRGEGAADGRFRIEHVPAGAHVLAVTAPGFAAQRADVHVGGADVDAGEIVLETGRTIQGRVRAPGGAGVPGASVFGVSTSGSDGMPGWGQAETGEGGAFVLAGVAEGRYSLTATAAGYASVTKTVDSGATGVELALHPAGSITGVVVDEAGRPVESFRTHLRPARAQGSSMGDEPEAELAGEGRFTLSDVGEGTFMLEIRARGYSRAVVPSVTVKAGFPTDVGRIRVQSGGTVRGNVSDTEGGPIPGAALSVRGPARESLIDVPQAESDGRGAFEITGAPAGLVTVTASHPRYAQGYVTGVDVDPARGPAEARIVLGRGGRIGGTVRRRDGAPVAGASVVVRSVPLGVPAPTLGLETVASTDADGRYLIERVTPGHALVVLMEREGSFHHSVLSFNTEVQEGGTATVDFDLREILVTGRATRGAVAAAGLRVSVSGRASRTFGFYGTPAPNLAPASPGGPQRMRATTREDGTYELLVHEPGEYRFDVETADGRLQFFGRTVQIPDVDTTTIDLDVGGSRLTGIVVDRDTQAPLAEAGVHAEGRAAGASTSAQTGPDGQFVLDVTPGPVQLAVRAEGYVRETVEVDATSDVGDLRVGLRRGVSLTGRVVDGGRRPVPNLFITATRNPRTPENASAGGRSQADGTFEISGVGPGFYAVLVRTDVGQFAFLPRVEAGAGPVVLQLQAGARLQLTVRGEDGSPVAGASAVVRFVGGAPVSVGGAGVSNERGELELVSPAGALGLEIRVRDHVTPVTVQATAGATVPLDVTLKPRAPETQ